MILTGKKTLITGGTGSLGRAILKRARQEDWKASITVYARNETKMAQVHAEFPEVNCVIGDVRDLDWLRTTMRGQEIVIHAAALKIVPMSEVNVRETVLTNVLGTANVAQACVEAGVERCVGVMSDKMVKPINLYGQTKACASAILREANTWGNTVFTMARYGNVLGSQNSIYPLLKRQLRENKPFTLTDERCTRFWLSINQGIDLILLALQQTAGVTVVPKAPASPVLTLMKALDPEHEIRIIGLRPGEKLHEQLIEEQESHYTFDRKTHFEVYPQNSVVSNFADEYGYYSNAPDYELTGVEVLKLAEIED